LETKESEVILLAESHVFTSEEDKEMDYSVLDIDTLPPKKFVRLVYCLGYGEKELADIKKNTGTWQFWKLFANCINIDKNPEVLKKYQSDFKERIWCKVELLETLRKRGVWLLDASIIALYGYGRRKKPPKRVIDEAIRISWGGFVEETITEQAKPRVLVIGKRVYCTLNEKLESLKIKGLIEMHDHIPQPQAHLSRDEQLNMLKKCYSFCALPG
jgi:hypothetical protein